MRIICFVAEFKMHFGERHGGFRGAGRCEAVGDYLSDRDFVDKMGKSAGVERAREGLAEPIGENECAVGEGSNSRTRERGVKRFKPH